MLQWNSLLKSLGFTDSEAKIYLLSLESGPSPVQDLAKKAKVSRVTTYAVIESLTERGLMSHVQKGKKTLYAAESPERLVSFVQTRLKSMESTLKEVETLIGELKLIQRGEKPVVKMFEGKEGLKAIQDDVLATNPEEVFEFTNDDALRSYLPREEQEHFLRELQQRNTKVKAILTSSQTFQPKPHSSVHQISEKTFSFFGDITIYNNKVALTTFQGNNFSVLIESEILAKTMKELFRLATDGADKHKKN